MTNRMDYDLIILGGGSAGMVAGVMAGGLGLRPLVIEKDAMGGECLNTGCVPSKALLHSARTAKAIRSAGAAGLTARTVERADAAGVMAHVRSVIREVERADATVELMRDHGALIRYGDFQFVDPHTIAGDGQQFRAANFLIATGSHPKMPGIPGISECAPLTNRTVFDLDAIPESMLVLGAGPVGVEMAQAFQMLGCQVTLVEQGDRILPNDDLDVSRELERFLRDDGVDIRLNTRALSMRMEGATRLAVLATNNGDLDLETEQVFVAVGRAPNLVGLRLDLAGVECGPDGILVDSAFRTSAAHIYACGDVLGDHQFSHMAEYEAKTAVRNIVFPGRAQAKFRIAPWCTFTDPESAHVGLTEEQATAQGLSYKIYRQPFAQNDRAITDGEARGFVKVLAAPWTGRILGAHILGPRAGELLQEWIIAMEKGMAIREVADLIHVYPTLSMASQHAAQRWYEQIAREPAVAAAISIYADRIRPRQARAGRAAAALLAAGAMYRAAGAISARIRKG